MYLQSIEVQGFKSFANKMKFQFHNGITGIVGPNGSGKSNVADAVRWVLGEQSARQLRGSNMQDVIFAGTENRKPLGFAAVSITLNNADHQLPTEYGEVTVSRRLYRSGESEYLLNGTVCRLRDIQELFYDTGIGKEGYSIIGQGQIDKILSGKPEERRELFDEAAGIVKFKRRRLAAQKKLDSEQENLTRVNDILAEITRQLEPLKRQSEKARIYLQKKEELKSFEVNMFLLDDQRVGAQLAEVEKKLEISGQDIENARQRLERARQEYETAEQELEKLNGELENQQQQVHQGEILQQQLESQISLLEEQIRSEKRNGEYYLTRMESIQAETEKHQLSRQEEEKRLLALKEELARFCAEESGFEQTLNELLANVQALEQQIADGQASMIELLNARSDTQARLQRYDTMAEQMQIRKAELTGRLLSAISEDEALTRDQDSRQREYDTVLQKIEALVEGNAQIEQKIQGFQGAMAAKGKELEEAQAEYHRLVSRLESLRNLTERYDGYGMSIRRVMEQKEKEAGLRGVVADLIKTEKKYETAIETALGGSIQNIVTDNEATAKRMIDFLKKNRYGRATFLPLCAIRRRGGLAKEQALYEAGALGVASTLVDAAEEYDQLVDYLLGQTLVVDQVDHAIAIARKYRHSLRIVTLDGELLSPGGSMSGGAFKNSSNLLGRRREMEELAGAVGQQEQRQEQLRRELEELRAQRSEQRRRLVEETEKLQQQYLLQNTARLKLQEIEEQKEKTVSGHTQLKQEIREIESQFKEIGAEQEKIQAELADSRQSEKEWEQTILEATSRLEAARRQVEEQNEKTAQAHTRTAELRQQEMFLQDNLKRLRADLDTLAQENRQLLASRSQAESDITEKRAQMQQIQEAIARAQEESGQILRQLQELQQKRQQSMAVHREFFQQREELATQMSELDKEHFLLENQKERLEDYRERQINYMWEEYGLTASEAQRYADPSCPGAAQLKKKIAQWKGEIRELGPVNVNAIETYKETAERHAFLTTQHDDLQKAGEDLKEIIRQLDAGMRRQFTEKFARMQTEFSKAFRELFGGGQATLELVEDEDILEAGIRIIAQPPGKKLQNMMQMSGGEKALTAIALLFAIQNMKPSPFCLLDEIEAALDENNVARYANYLKKLTKNTQFIIITHRRGTMAAADRLYGITMQEKGVSTQVSVNMLEEQLEA